MSFNVINNQRSQLLIFVCLNFFKINKKKFLLLTIKNGFLFLLISNKNLSKLFKKL